MLAKNKNLLGALFLFMFERALDVSGYTNLSLATGLWVLSGILLLMWLSHFLPEPPFKRKFMGPLILFSIGLVGIIGSGYWYYTIAKETPAPTDITDHPFSIIHPAPNFASGKAIRNREAEDEVVYITTYSIGVTNTSKDNKTIQGLELKAWFVGHLKI